MKETVTNTCELDQSAIDAQFEKIMQAERERQEELPFTGDTVRAVGSIVTALTFENGASGESKIEDDAFVEKEADFEQFESQARAIIDRLYLGDESGLGALPSDFRDALKARMDFRHRQLAEGDITEAGIQEELEKMYSVASVGLWKAAFGEANEQGGS